MSLIQRILQWLDRKGSDVEYDDPYQQYPDGRYCDDCLDREACMQGAPCWLVKTVNKKDRP